MRKTYDLVTSILGYADLYGNTLKVAKVRLTAAQIKLLFTTPQTLVAAPGAGKFIQIDKLIAYLDYSTAVFTGANNLEFRETNGAGTKVTADLSAAFLNAGADALVETSGIEAQITRLINKAIVVAVPVANPGGATAASTLTFIVFYRIVKVF